MCTSTLSFRARGVSSVIRWLKELKPLIINQSKNSKRNKTYSNFYLMLKPIVSVSKLLLAASVLGGVAVPATMQAAPAPVEQINLPLSKA